MHGLLLRVRNRVAELGLGLWLRPGKRVGLIRLGTDYGGWWVPVSALQPGAIAYCAGAGEDISFEAALVERGLRVTAFDPTPRAVLHVSEHGPQSPNFRFMPVGWWGERSTLRFFAPRNPAHVSHSVTNLQNTSDFFEAEVRPVHELAKELGDGRVDIVKMDIEGAEHAVIKSLIEHGPLPAVLCLEFDQSDPIRRLLRSVRELRRAGYNLRCIDRWNYTFVRK